MRSISPRSGTTLTHTLCAQRASTVGVDARAHRTMAQRRADVSDSARRTPAGTSVKTRLAAASQGGDGVRPNLGHVPSTSTGGNTPLVVRHLVPTSPISPIRGDGHQVMPEVPFGGNETCYERHDPRRLASAPCQWATHPLSG